MPAVSDPNVTTAGRARLAQVLARDKSADGRFVYVVGTVGVYCRPSCDARLAIPQNIAFYAGPAEAEAAEFRACKRCKRNRPIRTGAAAHRMGKVAAYIDVHADQSLTLQQLGDIAGISPFHLQRTFKAVIGVSPQEYKAAKRLDAFKSGLRAGGNVVDAVFDAGYGSTSRVYEQVDDGLGMTPSAYRAGGEGETIVYAVRLTVLGPLLMAATERGVCFVHFGESPDGLLKRLAVEFPKAALRGAAAEADTALNDWMEALDAHLSRGAPRPDLPVDLRGTAFQIRVWRFLLGVKTGEVVTYSEVARGAGAPRAIRAAASACGANRIGVLVPCHRALRADGGLGGYRWGVDRKRVLLDMERRSAAPEIIG